VIKTKELTIVLKDLKDMKESHDLNKKSTEERKFPERFEEDKGSSKE
jgi:hypothetical protein